MTLEIAMGTGLAAVLVAYLVIIYNGLVTLKNEVAKSFANIDVLLKQRFDELPKLVTVCKETMRHERDTLEAVITARNSVAQAQQIEDIKALGKAEDSLRAGLGQLYALAEAYPELKSNRSFDRLQRRISVLENSIGDRREFYNDTVTQSNVRIQQIPDIIIARLFSFGKFELLEFSEERGADVSIRGELDSSREK